MNLQKDFWVDIAIITVDVVAQCANLGNILAAAITGDSVINALLQTAMTKKEIAHQRSENELIAIMLAQTQQQENFRIFIHQHDLSYDEAIKIKKYFDSHQTTFYDVTKL